jgi:hypothetical protein
VIPVIQGEKHVEEETHSDVCVGTYLPGGGGVRATGFRPGEGVALGRQNYKKQQGWL